MKRNVPTLFALVVSVVMLAGCDLASILEIARPRQAMPGLKFVLQAEPLKTGERITSEQIQITKNILKERLTLWGFSPSNVQVQIIENNGITILFTVVRDRRDIELMTMRALVQRGFLEVLNGGDNPPGVGLPVITELGGPPADGAWPEDRRIWPVVATSNDLDTSKVSVQFDTTNNPAVVFTLNSVGTQK